MASSRLSPSRTAPSQSASAMRARYAGPLPARAVAISSSFSLLSQRVEPIVSNNAIALVAIVLSPTKEVIDAPASAARLGIARQYVRAEIILSAARGVPAKTE